MKVVYYVTGHGLGHATRVIEICKVLLHAGHNVTICTCAPHDVFKTQLPAENLSLRTVLLDFGASQLDAFTVDMKKSLEEYHKVAEVGRAATLEREVTWLQAQEADLVVSDVVPLACVAASMAGIPSVCVTNFTWDFIYSEHLAHVGSHFRRLVWQIAEDYARADLLLRLPGHCPMPAFREVVNVPLVARKAKKSPEQVRQELGLKEEEKLVVFMFGGQPAGDWQLRADSLPANWRCVVCSGGKLPAGKELPPNFILAEKDAYTPDLICAATCILGKIGYGTVSECLAHHRPLVFIRRDFFNEESFLRKQLEMYGLAVEMPRRDFLLGRWQAYLTHATTLQSTFNQPTNGAEVVADMLEDLVEEKKNSRAADRELSKRISNLALHRAASHGSVRLRDAIVFGYMMQRHVLNEKVEVPEWYMQGQSPLSSSPLVANAFTPESPSTAALDSWDLIEGDLNALNQCPDTGQFLAMLSELDVRPPAADAAAELPEKRAARGLFRWEDDILVTRAPGRLDVMGGIADYSGSLVLQMPIAPACHVAAQKHPPGAPLRLWRHIAARHAAAGGEKPVLRIVSMNSDTTNRGHAFDMDISELQQDGGPLPYAEARKYFKTDPSQSWAAYVAGALLVLMHEEGHVFTEGLSLLIYSEVPDGKGVSSSAALEVAAMSAIAAAYGVHLEGSQLAALCQKVENLVVGAPCGIMDQMASALGEKDSLMALRCQPAQLLPPVSIPAGLRFWGIDSGVRHSVGGLDYGTVRASAFMGLKIICSKADAVARQGSSLPRAHEPEQTTGSGEPTPIGGGYLANITPSEFRQFYFDLPVTLDGNDFAERYGQHWDAATQVEAEVSYPVAQAAAHPVEENFRVQSFRQLLRGYKPGDTEAATLLGELMYQSHASYNRCGLGSEATDRLVALTRAESAQARAANKPLALYGAKITGGGSGGTVCILGQDSQEGEDALNRVISAYTKETGGFAPTVFAGSSLGAAAFGTLRLRLKSQQVEPTMSGISV